MYASALLAAAAVSGCASHRLSAEAPPGVHLAGDWKLDAALSDDLGKAVGELHAQVAKARRNARAGQQSGTGSYTAHRRTGGDDSDDQQGGEPGQEAGAEGPESGALVGGAGPMPRGSPVAELMSSVPQGDYLKITVTATAFTVMSGDSSEEYTPGLESDISAEQGDAQQISGWEGAQYVIDTKPQWGPEIMTSYGLTKEGRLTMTVQLSSREIKLTFTRVYDRTMSVAPLAPPTIN